MSAVARLKELLVGLKIDSDERELEYLNFRKYSLTTLTAAGKKATGCTDGLIRLVDLMHSNTDHHFAFAVGEAEFKTNKSRIKLYQNLLELTSLSISSEFGQAVVLIATDLNKKWQLMFFDKPNHITIQNFLFGSVAISTFKGLLQTVKGRKAKLDLDSLPSIVPALPFAAGSARDEPGEQDLAAFGIASSSRADQLQSSQDMVNFLNLRYDANVTLPLSASSPGWNLYS